MWRPDKMVTHFISVFIIRNVREFAFLSCAALFRNLNSRRSNWWCWNKTIYFYPSRLFSYILTFDDGSSSMRSKESEDREPLFFLSFLCERRTVRSFTPLAWSSEPGFDTHNSLQPRCFHTPRCCRFSAGKSMNPLSTGLLGCWICLDDRLATASGLCRTKKSRGWKFASTDAQTRSRGAGGGNKESISTYLYLALHPIWNNRICQLLMLCQRFQKSL